MLAQKAGLTSSVQPAGELLADCVAGRIRLRDDCNCCHCLPSVAGVSPLSFLAHSSWDCQRQRLISLRLGAPCLLRHASRRRRGRLFDHSGVCADRRARDITFTLSRWWYDAFRLCVHMRHARIANTAVIPPSG